MQGRKKTQSRGATVLLLWCSVACKNVGTVGEANIDNQDTTVTDDSPLASGTPTLNLPQLNSEKGLPFGALFWWGKLSEDNNYAEGRIGFDADGVRIHLTAFDYRLWYDESPKAEQLEQWDAFSIYIAGPNTDPSNVIRVVAQLQLPSEDGSNHASYRRSEESWQPVALDYTVTTGYRGSNVNSDNGNASGWSLDIAVDYSALGIQAAPAAGTEMRLAVVMHDRDHANDAMPAETPWPRDMSTDDEETWAKLRFGVPAFEPPSNAAGTSYEIYNGHGGQSVMDAHVGGGTTCGGQQGSGIQKFTQWGNLSYPASVHLNIQNQWDVADSGCFSKVYLSFPLNSLPSGKLLQAAHLRMHHFGNSLPNEAPDSYIQVHTTVSGWSEDDLTWNNAPSSVENLSATTVQPLPAGYQGQPVAYHWDVSRAVRESYESRAPVTLVLYSGDAPRHTGKYFVSSNGSEANPERRPSLIVTLTDP